MPARISPVLRRIVIAASTLHSDSCGLRSRCAQLYATPEPYTWQHGSDLTSRHETRNGRPSCKTRLPFPAFLVFPVNSENSEADENPSMSRHKHQRWVPFVRSETSGKIGKASKHCVCTGKVNGK